MFALKEIGGYFEFEHYHGKMLHDDGIKLDCGRSCLAYLIQARNIKRIAMPSFMCDAVFDLCKQYNVELHFYDVNYDFKPKNLMLAEGEYLYLANYYGQLSTVDIEGYREQFKRVIVDNTQAYFEEPISNIDTLYTCRKFFGVPDGGILYTTCVLNEEIDQSESYSHMNYLLGRFERSASEFYEESARNNNRFEGQPLLRMSKLTENLLRGIDYELVKSRRDENYAYLHSVLAGKNRLQLKQISGPFAYPLLLDEEHNLRKELAKEKIYIPVLWPNVVNDTAPKKTDYDLAMNILPLPCDQRYTIEDMKRMSDTIISLI